MEKIFCVYITASKWRGTIYTGMSGDMPKRAMNHKLHLADGFTKKYHVTRLVYVETHPDAQSAAARERAIKKWNRDWKIRLIEKDNPEWRDLYDEICQ